MRARSSAWPLAVVCAALLSARAPAVAADRAITVDRGSVARFTGSAGTVTFPIRNGSERRQDTILSVDLLDPADRIRSSGRLSVILDPGSNNLKIDLPFDATALPPAERERLGWYRLRIVLEGPGSTSRDTWIVPVAAAAEGLFDLSVASPQILVPGPARTILVEARARPAGRPVPGVAISVTLAGQTIGDGVTGEDGSALVELDVPRSPTDGAQLQVRGTKGPITETRLLEVFLLGPRRTVFVTTDKLLYQPGQTVHARAVAIEPGVRTVAGVELSLSLTGRDGRVASATATTSRAGIASTDLVLPADVALGEYEVRVEDAKDPDRLVGLRSLRVSRYELPSFAVEARPDRSFYRRGEAPRVDVSARYLFGKPVPRGHVRVLEDQSWYGSREGGRLLAEGDAGPEGEVSLALDVERHRSFLDSRWSQFHDVACVAEVTDPTTGRSERQRFDVRLTEQPIHVYLVAPAPSRLYVSTSYADGRPASADVSLARQGVVLARVTTNRYGVARLDAARFGESERDLDATARDRSGVEGRHKLTAWLPRPSPLRLEAGRTVHLRGEGITAEITSTGKADALLLVNVTSGFSPLFSRAVRLYDGRARVTFPYRSDFSGLLSVSAHPADAGGPGATRAVLYPRDPLVGVSARPRRPVLRPGEEATVDVTLTAGSRPQAGVLGVAVVDEGVDRRLAAEPWSRPLGLDDLLETLELGGGVGGVSRLDLERLDPRRRPAEDLDLVAELLLASDLEAYGARTLAPPPRPDLASLFDVPITSSLGPVLAALDAAYRSRGTFPADGDALRRELAASGLSLDEHLDPWGTPYRARFTFRQLELESAGPDQRHDTDDDFVARRRSWSSVETAGPAASAPMPAQSVVRGRVTDRVGSALPGVVVSWEGPAAGKAVTDAGGQYVTPLLPPGLYAFRFHLAGFAPYVVEHVPVRLAEATVVDATLVLSTGAPEVTVTAEAPAVETRAASAGSTPDRAAKGPRAARRAAPALSTPRLRAYFPETLFWNPALETDRSGRAAVRFRLADALTTWKVSLVASTSSGRLGFGETTVEAFQPLFAELDPPLALTVGDRVEQPVLVRSYLDEPEDVEMTLRPGPGLSAAPARVAGRARPGEPARAIVSLEAIRPGKTTLRATARGRRANDAVERPIEIRPDGEERLTIAADLFESAATLIVEVPRDALPGSIQAQVTVWPGLLAQTVDGIDSILVRPYGCGEQTISSTYPNVLALRLLAARGVTSGRLVEKARRNVAEGVDRLRQYRSPDGGLTYWGPGRADLALTAYGLRLLLDARDFVAVDEASLREMERFLDFRLEPDGGSADDQAVHASILRSLAAATASSEGAPRLATVLRELQAGLPAALCSTDAHAVASLLLAAVDAGDRDAASRLGARLRDLAGPDGTWSTRTATPFHGWGRAGAIETTALALLALVRLAPVSTLASADPSLRQAVVHLMKEKDRYGIWHSTQATVAVLSLLAALDGGDSGGAGSADLLVNGRAVSRLAWRSDADRPAPVDVTPALVAGPNRIELRRASGHGLLAAQAVARHAAPWDRAPGASSAQGLLLSVRPAREGRVGEAMLCEVEAGRLRPEGRGMLLAEIGLPPGAEVDHASLDAAIRETGNGLSRYEVLPDRVVAYLWPGGTRTVRFRFTFRPRLAIHAKAAPSLLYDYYNPDARVTVPPDTFTVTP